MSIHESTSTIQAPPEAVWSVLVDVGAYDEWDSGLERVAGTIALGHRIRLLHGRVPGSSKNAESLLRVTELVPNERMVWSGSVWILAKNTQTFELEKHFEATQFTMREEHGGLLSGLVGAGGGSNVEHFVQGLKARVEALLSA